MLLYIIVPLYIFWCLTHMFLWLQGHHPVQFFPLQFAILVANAWMVVDSVINWDTPDTLLYVGLVLPVVMSILWVPATLHLAKFPSNTVKWIWNTLLVMQVVGYFVLCLAFCLLEAVVSACVCGGCLVLVFVYVVRLYNSSASDNSNTALLSMSI
jgi:hypothetical protein